MLTLYFGYLLALENCNLFERWEQFKFCTWGIVEDNTRYETWLNLPEGG